MYLAHSLAGRAEEEWHSLADHLEATAAIAELNAGGVWGRAAGLLHDVGKYSAEFQARVRGAPERVDHSTAGAQIAVAKYGPMGKLLAYAIVGHHGGMPNAIDRPGGDNGGRRSLTERLADLVPDCASWATEIVLPAHIQAPPLTFHPTPTVARDRVGFALAHHARMTFSALVDADYIDTEGFYARAEGWSPDRGNWPTLHALARALDAFMAGFVADTPVRQLRGEILSAARAGATSRPGLFALTVPTGGGKTLASLVWALAHARAHGRDRVIYVIPYTSIIEQTADVFRGALGPHADCVVEHHSAFSEIGSNEARAKLRRATENWDAPIIVTTAVQFFESLFSNRPGRCRKLHNIACSVVILDEAQTLPVDLLMPCVAMLDEMARNYGTSILLCTATQPALTERPEDPKRSLDGGLRGVRELAPAGLHEQLRRVSVRMVGRLSDADLVAALAAQPQGLCIVNTRRHARDLYMAMDGTGGAVHLSALMCPAHRSEVLAALRPRIAAGEPVRLVATSLIEAGVDIDFPLVWRAMAGLPSIAQAAGRCNREGRRSADESIVTVFEPSAHEPHYMAQETAVARVVLAAHPDDPLSPEAIDAYFSQLFWRRSLRPNGLDVKRILPRLEERRAEMLFPFEDIANDFRFIDEIMEPVVIPYDAEARLLIAALERADHVGRLARGLQRYVVQIPTKDFDRFRQEEAIASIAPDRFADQFTVLVDLECYRPDLGLDIWR